MKDRVLLMNDKVVVTLLQGNSGTPSAGLIMNYSQCFELARELIEAGSKAREFVKRQPVPAQFTHGDTGAWPSKK